MLDVETQSEKHGEDGVHLSCQQEECRIPDGSVHRSPELALRLREEKEVHVLKEVYQNDACDGNASEDVCNIDSCVRLCRCSKMQ